jgi:hypothetical protein
MSCQNRLFPPGLTRYALSKGYISLNQAATFSPLAGEAAQFPNPHGLRV